MGAVLVVLGLLMYFSGGFATTAVSYLAVAAALVVAFGFVVRRPDARWYRW